VSVTVGAGATFPAEIAEAELVTPSDPEGEVKANKAASPENGFDNRNSVSEITSATSAIPALLGRAKVALGPASVVNLVPTPRRRLGFDNGSGKKIFPDPALDRS
jgi:hypothetical protein